MGRTAANYLVGGALAAAGLALAVPPVLAADPASARGFSTVRATPSAGGNVTFEILPAPTPTPTQPEPPTPTPTQPPPTPTPTQPTPAPPQPSPSHGGELPVTGSDGSTLLLTGLGMTLLIVGGLAVRRRRPV